MKLFPLSLLALFLPVSGCTKKEVPEGSPIAVEGYVTSSRNGRPLENVRVKVHGLNRKLKRIEIQSGPTEATTDRNGYFYINFRADGSAAAYEVVVAESPFLYEGGPSPVSLNSQQFNSVRLTALEKGIFQVNLKVRHNPFDTLYISGGWSNKPEYLLKGLSIDTTLQFPYIPGTDSRVNIKVWDNFRPRVYRELIPNAVGDTFMLPVTIDNTANLPYD